MRHRFSLKNLAVNSKKCYFENSSDKSYCAKFARQVVNAGGGHFLPNTWTGGNNVWSTSVINGSHIYEYKNGTVK